MGLCIVLIILILCQAAVIDLDDGVFPRQFSIYAEFHCIISEMKVNA